MTPREALVRSHQVDGLAANLNGVETSSTFRFLIGLTALVAREQGGRVEKSFSPEAIDKAFVDLKPWANLYDEVQPFGQVLVDDISKLETLTKAKPAVWDPTDPGKKGVGPVHFWSRMPSRESVNPSGAVLLVHSYITHSGVDNTLALGIKSTSGAPAYDPPSDYSRTTTEVLWQGSSLFETLASNTPLSWVAEGGTVAWADPNCDRSFTDGQEHPLWQATWSPNALGLGWDENGNAILARRAGTGINPPTAVADATSAVPERIKEAQYKLDKLLSRAKPATAKQIKDSHDALVKAAIPDTKTSVTKWALQCKHESPFFVVGTKEFKGVARTFIAQVRIGQNETDLATEWAQSGCAERMAERPASLLRLRNPRVMLLRHLLHSSVTSTGYLKSTATVHEAEKWAALGKNGRRVKRASTILRSLRWDVTQCFAKGSPLEAFGKMDRNSNIGTIEGDVENAFWDAVSSPFEKHIVSGDGDIIDDKVWRAVHQATLDAFDAGTMQIRNSKTLPVLLIARDRLDYQAASRLGLITTKTTEQTPASEEDQRAA